MPVDRQTAKLAGKRLELESSPVRMLGFFFFFFGHAAWHVGS